MLEKTNVLLATEDFIYSPDYIKSGEASTLFNSILSNSTWNQDYFNFGGKKVREPRQTTFFADAGLEYTYSGIKKKTFSWTEDVFTLRRQIEEDFKVKLNSCLVNLYVDGNDSVSWHSDDETSLGTDPVIVSVSLGQEREFQWKPLGGRLNRLMLKHGSLFLMKSGFQKKYQHRLPKMPQIHNPRINLTFRYVSEHQIPIYSTFPK